MWLVSEFCNRGPLLTAIERGAFLTQPSSQYGQPNLISVLQTLQEVAAALQYLHRNDILHGWVACVCVCGGGERGGGRTGDIYTAGGRGLSTAAQRALGK